MVSSAAIGAGIIGGIAFAVGWVWDPIQPAVMTTTLVCGLATIFGQMSTRDLLTKAMALVERGADEIKLDGGELLHDANRMRIRTARLAIIAQMAGVLAPASATFKTIVAHQGASAVAFTAGAIALFLSWLLYHANNSLAQLIIAERSRRAIAKAQKEAAEKIKPSNDPAVSEVNLKGFQLIGHSK